MLAYVGPESVAPIASGIAAFLGFLLIGWRWIRTQCKRIYRFVFRIKDDDLNDDEDPKDLSQDSKAPNREPQKLQETGS